MFEVHVHRDGELIEMFSVETQAEVDLLIDPWGELDGYDCSVREILSAEELDASPDDEEYPVA